MSENNGWLSCWCYEKTVQVDIKGTLEPGSIAQILTVEHCREEAGCDRLLSPGCLVGKRREGKFCDKKEET